MTGAPCGRSRLVYLIVTLLLASAVAAPARADFFDGVRRTFTTDIPHFFQDDIPCAFGGQPTSHTRTSCKSSGHPAERTSDDVRGRADAGSGGTNVAPETKPNYDP